MERAVQLVGDTQAFAEYTLAEAQRRDCHTLENCVMERAGELVDDALARVQGRSLVCVLVGRWYTTGIYPLPSGKQIQYQGTGSGQAACAVHDPLAPTASKVQIGTFTFDGAHAWTDTDPGPYHAHGMIQSRDFALPAGTVDVGSQTYTIRKIWGLGSITTAQGGAWTGPGLGAPRALGGATSLVSTAPFDPSGGQDDLYIRTVLVFQSVGDDTGIH